jgi:hypothetical protein
MFSAKSLTPLRTLLCPIAAGVLSCLAILSGTTPSLSAQGFDWSTIALAQSADEVVRYSRAAYEIEQLRQRNYAKAKRIMGGNVPEDVCQRQNIPGEVQRLCGDLQADSMRIIGEHGLSPAQFNRITRDRQTNPALERQIQQELIRLQRAR